MNAPDGQWPRPVTIPDVRMTIDYDDYGGTGTRRTITAHRARQGVASVMIEATCHLRGPGRVFRLDRIKSIYDDGRRHDPVEYFTDLLRTKIQETNGPKSSS